MQVYLLEPIVFDSEMTGYGEFRNSLTFREAGTDAMPTVGIAEHTGGSDHMTVPVANWDEYLSGWQQRDAAGHRNVPCQLQVGSLEMRTPKDRWKLPC